LKLSTVENNGSSAVRAYRDWAKKIVVECDGNSISNVNYIINLSMQYSYAPSAQPQSYQVQGVGLMQSQPGLVQNAVYPVQSYGYPSSAPTYAIQNPTATVFPSQNHAIQGQSIHHPVMSMQSAPYQISSFQPTSSTHPTSAIQPTPYPAMIQPAQISNSSIQPAQYPAPAQYSVNASGQAVHFVPSVATPIQTQYVNAAPTLDQQFNTLSIQPRPWSWLLPEEEVIDILNEMEQQARPATVAAPPPAARLRAPSTLPAPRCADPHC
jgi:hypothetical protein